MDRATRRRRTLRHGARARSAHLQLVHPDGAGACPCGRSGWYFAKRGALGCDCRGRQHGTPKLGRGVCHLSGSYRPAVVARIAGRRLCRAWLGVAGALDDVEL